MWSKVKKFTKLTLNLSPVHFSVNVLQNSVGATHTSHSLLFLTLFLRVLSILPLGQIFVTILVSVTLLFHSFSLHPG